MDRQTSQHDMDGEERTLSDRIDGLITSVNPDFYLAGALLAVVLPWVEVLA